MLMMDVNHIYRNEQNIVIPNVTSILEAEGFTDFSKVPPQFLRASQEFGKHVHIASDLADKGTLDYESLSPSLLPYVEGWCRFLEEFDAEVIKSEVIVESKVWRFCGTLDRLLSIKGVLGIYDIKTGDGCSLQTAFYKVAAAETFPELKIKERAAIKLFKNGTYQRIPHNDKSEENLVKSVMNVWNSRAKYNKGVYYGINRSAEEVH